MMSRLLTLLLVGFLLLAPACGSVPQKPCCPILVYFSPHGGATEAIVKELGQAKTSVLVQAYSFTSAPIANALLDAHKRGVKVQVLLDKKRRLEKSTKAPFLHSEGVTVRIDPTHPHAHNKTIIIDGETVITGSFNFSEQAEEGNAENLLVIQDRKLADLYTRNRKEHAEHSEAYSGRGR